MNIDEAISQIPQIIAGFIDAVKIETEIAAEDAISTIQDRVVEDGLNPSGKQYDPYSKNKLPLFFFAKTSRADVLVKLGIDANGKRVGKKKSNYPDGISYYDWRILMGRPVDHVNFSLTNDMWNSIGIVEETITDTEARVVVKGRDTFTNQKLEWNTKLKGDILKMSKDEEKSLVENYGIRMEQKLSSLMKDWL